MTSPLDETEQKAAGKEPEAAEARGDALSVATVDDPGARPPIGLSLLAAAVAALTLFVDLSLPLGVTAGFLYVVLVLIGLWLPSPRGTFVLAGIGSVLTVAGYVLSEPAAAEWVVITNRILALMAIWVTAGLVYRHLESSAGLAQKNHEIAKKMREILEKSPMGVAIVSHARKDTRITGTRLFVNDAFVRMFGGASREQMMATEISDSWADLNQLRQVEEIMTSGGELNDFEALRRRVDGTEWWVSMNSCPIEFEGRDCTVNWHFDITERKKSISAVYESEERFRVAFENAPIGVALTTPEGHRFKVNTALADFLGYTVDELTDTAMKSTAGDFGDLDESMRLRQQVLDGEIETYRNERRYRHKQGHIVWGEVSGSLFRNAKGEPDHFIAHTIDITERKQAEQALRESESLLDSIFENIPAGLLIKDRNHIVERPNRAYLTWYGMDAEEMVGTRSDMVDGFQSEEDAQIMHAQEDEVLATGKSLHRQIARPFADGRIHILDITKFPIYDEHGNVDKVGSISVDITERERAENALRENENQLKALTHSITDAIIAIDDGNRIIQWNQGARDIFGYEEAEVMGQPLSMLLPERYREHHNAAVKRVKTTGKTTLIGQTLELAGLRKDGSEFPAEISLGSWISKGEKRYFSGVVRDIAERKALEAELGQALKMEALGQMTGGVAHEFNNLLHVLTMNLELLDEEMKDVGSPSKRTANLLKTAFRGKDLTDRLLSYVGQQIISPKVVDAGSLVRETVELLRPMIGEAVDVETPIADDLWPIRVDPGELQTALINLAVNARDAMAKGGQIVIEATNTHLDDAFAASRPYKVKTGDYVEITVRDTGAGMSPRVAERAFDPFFTTKEVGSGTGLGLSMVFGFVTKQSGGHVDIASEEGRGTTVSLYFPRTAAEDKELPETTDKAETPSEGAGRILVVEDNAEVLDLTVEALEKMGHKAIKAKSGAEALALLEGSDPVDLLLTDVILPGGMSGPELAEAVQEKRPGIGVVFMTGYPDEELSVKGILDESIHRLRKPFPGEELVNALQAVLGDRNDQ